MLYLVSSHSDGNPIFIVLFIVVAIGILAYSIYASYMKKKKLREFAESHGYTFCPTDYFGIMGKCAGFRMFNVGHSKRVYNQIFGVLKGYEFCFFQYKYVTGSGKNRTTHIKDGLLVMAKMIVPGELNVRPENYFDKIAEVIGFDDIDFEYNEFNKKYFVKASDKRMAYDFFGRDMMEYFVRLPFSLKMEAKGHLFLFQYGSKLIPIDFYDRMLDIGVNVFSHIDPIAREKFGLPEEEHDYNQQSDEQATYNQFFGGIKR